MSYLGFGTLQEPLGVALRVTRHPARAELDKHITPVVFRHTYTATRLQTTDNGAPVSIFTVARELGHRGIDRIEDTYGHLQRKRERLEEVRYK